MSSALAGNRQIIALRAFLDWWQHELRDLLPRAKPELASALGGITLRLLVDRVSLSKVEGVSGVRWETDRPIGQIEDGDWTSIADIIGDQPFNLILPTHQCLAVSVEIPAASRAWAQQVIALQLATRLPLQMSHIVWGHRLDDEAGHAKAHVVVARLSVIEKIDLTLAMQGLRAPAVYAQTDAGDWILLRKAPSRSQGQAERLVQQAWLFLVLCGLMIIPVTIAAAQIAMQFNHSEITRLQDTLRPRLVAEREARRDEQMRGYLRPLTSQTMVSATLAPVAEQLPDTAWLAGATQLDRSTAELLVEGGESEALAQAIGNLPGFVSAEPANAAAEQAQQRTVVILRTR